jgi:hypothetical protein
MDWDEDEFATFYLRSTCSACHNLIARSLAVCGLLSVDEGGRDMDQAAAFVTEGAFSLGFLQLGTPVLSVVDKESLEE